MKIRILAIIYIIVLVITGAFLYRRIEDREVYDIDMLALNSKSYEISQELTAGTDPEALEEKYDCFIVLCSEAQYESENNMFIREGYSVFDYVKDGTISGKVAFAAREEEYIRRENNEKRILAAILFAAFLLGLGILFVVWYFFVRPFNDLKVFAEHVSKGNLDLPLKMRKHNYFGAFTESFDRMREELKKAS